MSLSFDKSGLPACCGLGLVPGEPHTVCPRCRSRFNTAELADKVAAFKREQAINLKASGALGFNIVG